MSVLRVAHIGWLASSHLERRASELAMRGVPTVVFTDHVPAHFQNKQLPFRVEIIPPLTESSPLELIDWLERKMADLNVTLLHIHSTHFPAALGFFVRTLPKLTSIWDFVHSRDSVSPLYHKVILDELLSGGLSEAVSFSSKVVLDRWLSKGFPASRGFWHSWGVDLGRFSMDRDEEKINELRMNLGIKPDEKVIFSPRTPSLPANTDLLLQALPLLKDSDKIKCILTGHAIPPETRYLERIIRRDGIFDKIRFVNPIHDQATLSLYYQQADLVISLHSNDHNPATVLESMAVGGILVINESSTVEYWIKDRRNGFVARTRDLNHLVLKLNQGLDLTPEAKANWQQYNRSKIELEANFHHTIHQVIADYQVISMIGQLPPCSSFHKGLLFDICRLNNDAKKYYGKAIGENAKSRYLKPLIDEKDQLLDPGKGIISFHGQRACQTLSGLHNKPIKIWKEHLVQLSYPKSLFRHDLIAGFYPLMSEGRFDDLLFLIRLVANRFHTDTLEWIAECINWFGGHWSMWEECTGLLLAVEKGGTSLGYHALSVGAKLGYGHGNYRNLLENAYEWTRESIAEINGDLDKRFRQDINQESSFLLNQV
ncbi:MAG: glycosyltransferase [Desulfobacula sp.]|jgi:glycosyltransferase involved in cell wall biosynthesis|nr:glycosyltransferase [Desulfobacula sp.]